MNQLFRRIPFSVKLILIGLVPLIFLLYLTQQIYVEKTEKLNLLTGYIEKINQSANISSLIDALQNERKISFDFSFGKAGFTDILKQRPVTDAALLKLKKSTDESLIGFTQYTSISKLAEIREKIDQKKADANQVMHYYSNMIFRLNTMNTISLPNNSYLQPVYKDLVSQKLLTEMITYMGIIRSNVYNVLNTRKYMIETMIGTLGTYDVLKSYESEFLMKAPPYALKEYRHLTANTDLHLTVKYLDTLFKKFSFDSAYSADQWWTISNNGINELSLLQKNIWLNSQNGINRIYQIEKNKRLRSFLLLIIALIIVGSLITYTIIVIGQQLNDLRQYAHQIAKGDTRVRIHPVSGDYIASLNESIAGIAITNKVLSEAADSIGRGNFNVNVLPRSKNDVLSISLEKMKDALKQYSEEMQLLVKQRTEELERSNEDLQQFAHVVSHDLKEPLRKIRTFTERLLDDGENRLTKDSIVYLARINQSATRMNNMIEGILIYSSVNASNEPFELIDLNTILENVMTDLELMIEQKSATINIQKLPLIEGAPVLLNQLFYNLLNNALKFSREGITPVIDISCKKGDRKSSDFHHEDCFELTIKDNGIGFDPQYAESIFKSFNRLHSRNKFEGTGLGLALCKKIINYHHGKIWAESNEKGSAFRIIIPQKQHSANLVNN